MRQDYGYVPLFLISVGQDDFDVVGDDMRGFIEQEMVGTNLRGLEAALPVDND